VSPKNTLLEIYKAHVRKERWRLTFVLVLVRTDFSVSWEKSQTCSFVICVQPGGGIQRDVISGARLPLVLFSAILRGIACGPGYLLNFSYDPYQQKKGEKKGKPCFSHSEHFPRLCKTLPLTCMSCNLTMLHLTAKVSRERDPHPADP
jgi:hypothetical protein